MLVLGLNHGELTSSAALVRDGEVVAAACEERFNRSKRSRAFPRRSIEFCLQRAGIGLSDCDFVAQGWNPGAAWVKFNPAISGQRIRREDYFYQLPDNLYSLVPREAPGDWVLQTSADPGLPPQYYVQHHRAHAALSFYTSPFEEAAFLTADWRGELECTTWGVGRGTSLEVLQSQWLPHSLGMFYATYTELLGYRPDSDEWKVMALSAFRLDHSDLLEKVRSTYRLKPDGTLELDARYYKGIVLDQPNLYTPELVALTGGRVGQAGEEPDDWHLRMAVAMQLAAEEIATHMLCRLHELTGLKRVVLGGGFFMNCVYNARVVQQTPFEEVYIPAAPTDQGNSLGAALYVAHHLKAQPRTRQPASSFLGPEYSDTEIEAALKRRKLTHERLEDPSARTAQLLAEGHVVAWFQGRMEFGERALGCRSILADPRRDDVKDRINAMIKYREGYRPFAPAVAAEDAPTWFDVAPGFTAEFMERVANVRPEHRQSLPGITHVDGSARLQTVREAANPPYYRVIREFGRLTGVPVVLNTSFNINAEPIVCTPDDALNTFFNSGLEYLVVGSFLLRK